MSNPSAWSRLRWPIKALIIAAPLIAVGYGAIEKGWFSPKTETEQTQTTEKPTNNEEKTNEPNTTKPQTASTGEARTFLFQPEKPVNGELKGVVEVGATGFNSFVINMDKEKRWEIKTKDFGKSMVYEGMASVEDIRIGLKNYIADMFDKGVKSKNIHFVISSVTKRGHAKSKNPLPNGQGILNN